MLSQEQEVFCQAVADGAGRRAAVMQARPGVSPTVAATTATRWLNKPEIALRVAILRGSASDEDLATLEQAVRTGSVIASQASATVTSTRTEIITNSDRDRIATGLWKIARVCMGEEFAETEVIDAFGNSTITKKRSIDPKSALRALELLGKMDTVGLFVERKRLDIKTEAENLTDRELDEEINKYSGKLN